MEQPNDNARLVREPEAAEILAVKPATLRRWRWEGRGPRFHKIGRAVRYRHDELRAFVDGTVRQSTSQVSGVAHG